MWHLVVFGWGNLGSEAIRKILGLRKEPVPLVAWPTLHWLVFRTPNSQAEPLKWLGHAKTLPFGACLGGCCLRKKWSCLRIGRWFFVYDLTLQFLNMFFLLGKLRLEGPSKQPSLLRETEDKSYNPEAVLLVPRVATVHFT